MTLAHNKRLRDDETLRNIETEIANMEDEHGRGYQCSEHKDHLTSLATQRDKILKDREESWRPRSRVIWLQEGDNNTKFYHKFANGCRVINTIWQMTNKQGIRVHSFRHLASLTTSQFMNLYKAPPNASLAKIVRVSQLFPCFMN